MSITANPRAGEKARALLGSLCDIAGKGIITGQHTQTNPMEEIDYIRSVTGKEPKLRGFELLSYSPNINYGDADEACLTEIAENRGTADTAIKWASGCDGIVTLSFHWFSPMGGRDKSFYAKNTDFDASAVLLPGTAERAAFYSDMDRIAEVLRGFRDAGIPVLWRPFHESDGTWFWWGAKGCEVARDLYRLMFEHYTRVHGLDNLVWVWNCTLPEGYPGDEYVDVVSGDYYLEKYRATDYAEQYRQLIAATTADKPAALAEVGYIPDIDMLERSRVPWTYFMSWSKEFIIGEQYNSADSLRRMYSAGYAVTL